MAKNYLCRIRLDRAGEEGKAESGAIETGRFYARVTDWTEKEITDEEKRLTDLKAEINALEDEIKAMPEETDEEKKLKEDKQKEKDDKQEKYNKAKRLLDATKSCKISLSEFLEFTFSGTDVAQNSVNAIKGLVNLQTEVSESQSPQTTEFTGTAYTCPLCEKVLVTKEEDVAEDAFQSDKKVINIDRHIKTCSVCNRYYCDGDGEKVEYEDEDGKVAEVYKTHKDHFDKYDHFPIQVETERQPEIVKPEDIRDLSLIKKFKVAAYTFDGKDINNVFADSLNSYIKEYTTETTYLSYKYEVSEDNGGYVLRCKIEFTPSDYFLNRSNEYDSIDKLKVAIDKFLTYTENENIEEDNTEENENGRRE